MFWLFLGAVNFLRVLGHLQCFKPIRDFLDRCCSSCVISCQDCANVAFGKVKAGCGACFGWLGMHCGVLLRGMKTICNKGVQRWKASCSAKPGASHEDEAVDQRGVVRTLFFTLYHGQRSFSSSRPIWHEHQGVPCSQAEVKVLWLPWV